jgi:hypothetical protein
MFYVFLIQFIHLSFSSLWPTAKLRIAENGDGRIYGAHGAGNFDLRLDRKWKDKYLKPKTSRAGPKRSQHAKMGRMVSKIWVAG